MSKTVLILSVLVAVLLTESSCQGYRIIRPTYRPPRRRPIIIIRKVRETPKDEPLWLYNGDVPRAPASGDHPTLPKYIDDIRLDPSRRYARSLDSPGAKRGGGSNPASGSSGNTGPTHPGYNRRQAREIRIPFLPRPFDPRPRPPRPFDPFNPLPRPGPRPIYPVYA